MTVTGNSTETAAAIADSAAVLGYESSNPRPEGHTFGFVDYPFRDPSATFEDHLEAVEREEPALAVAPDLDDTRDPADVYEKADRLAEHVTEAVVVVPKSTHPRDVPDRFRVGVPLADGFGDGSRWTAWDYAARPDDSAGIHLLGGSARLQHRLITNGEIPRVRSVDGSGHLTSAEKGYVFTPGKWWFAGRTDDRGLYDLLELSLDNYAATLSGRTEDVERPDLPQVYRNAAEMTGKEWSHGVKPRVPDDAMVESQEDVDTNRVTADPTDALGYGAPAEPDPAERDLWGSGDYLEGDVPGATAEEWLAAEEERTEQIIDELTDPTGTAAALADGGSNDDAHMTPDDFTKTLIDGGNASIESWTESADPQRDIEVAQEALRNARREFGHHDPTKRAHQRWLRDNEDEIAEELYVAGMNMGPKHYNTAGAAWSSADADGFERQEGLVPDEYQPLYQARSVLAWTSDKQPEHLADAQDKVAEREEERAEEERELKKAQRQAQDFLDDPPQDHNGWTWMPSQDAQAAWAGFKRGGTPTVIAMWRDETGAVQGGEFTLVEWLRAGSDPSAAKINSHVVGNYDLEGDLREASAVQAHLERGDGSEYPDNYPEEYVQAGGPVAVNGWYVAYMSDGGSSTLRLEHPEHEGVSIEARGDDLTLTNPDGETVTDHESHAKARSAALIKAEETHAKELHLADADDYSGDAWSTGQSSITGGQAAGQAAFDAPDDAGESEIESVDEVNDGGILADTRDDSDDPDAAEQGVLFEPDSEQLRDGGQGGLSGFGENSEQSEQSTNSTQSVTATDPETGDSDTAEVPTEVNGWVLDGDAPPSRGVDVWGAPDGSAYVAVDKPSDTWAVFHRGDDGERATVASGQESHGFAVDAATDWMQNNPPEEPELFEFDDYGPTSDHPIPDGVLDGPVDNMIQALNEERADAHVDPGGRFYEDRDDGRTAEEEAEAAGVTGDVYDPTADTGGDVPQGFNGWAKADDDTGDVNDPTADAAGPKSKDEKKRKMVGGDRHGALGDYPKEIEEWTRHDGASEHLFEYRRPFMNSNDQNETAKIWINEKDGQEFRLHIAGNPSAHKITAADVHPYIEVSDHREAIERLRHILTTSDPALTEPSDPDSDEENNAAGDLAGALAAAGAGGEQTPGTAHADFGSHISVSWEQVGRTYRVQDTSDGTWQRKYDDATEAVAVAAKAAERRQDGLKAFPDGPGNWAEDAPDTVDEFEQTHSDSHAVEWELPEDANESITVTVATEDGAGGGWTFELRRGSAQPDKTEVDTWEAARDMAVEWMETYSGGTAAEYEASSEAIDANNDDMSTYDELREMDVPGNGAKKLARNYEDLDAILDAPASEVFGHSGVGAVAMNALIGKGNSARSDKTVRKFRNRNDDSEEEKPTDEFEEGDRVEHSDGRTGTVTGTSHSGVTVDYDDGGETITSPKSLTIADDTDTQPAAELDLPSDEWERVDDPGVLFDPAFAYEREEGTDKTGHLFAVKNKRSDDWSALYNSEEMWETYHLLDHVTKEQAAEAAEAWAASSIMPDEMHSESSLALVGESDVPQPSIDLAGGSLSTFYADEPIMAWIQDDPFAQAYIEKEGGTWNAYEGTPTKWGPDTGEPELLAESDSYEAAEKAVARLFNQGDTADEPDVDAEDKRGEKVEFGRLDDANDWRDDNPDALKGSDSRATKTVTLRHDVDADTLEDAEEAALISKGDDVKKYGQAELTDDERNELEKRDGWTWGKKGFHAMSAKAILRGEGIDDWLAYYDHTLADAADHHSIIENDREMAVAEGTTSAGGDTFERAESAGEAARAAEKANAEACDDAAEAVEDEEPGHEDAADYLRNECGYTDEEIAELREQFEEMGEPFEVEGTIYDPSREASDAIEDHDEATEKALDFGTWAAQNEPAAEEPPDEELAKIAPTPTDDPEELKGMPGPALRALKKAWSGYKLARQEHRQAEKDAEKYASVINGVRVVNGQDAMSFDDLDGWDGGEIVADDPTETYPTDDGQMTLEEAADAGRVDRSVQGTLGEVTDGGVYDPTLEGER